MSRTELSVALNLSPAELVRECRATFFWMRNSHNMRRMSDRQIWREVQTHLTERAERKAEMAARAIREDWAGQDAAVRAEFLASDIAAGRIDA